MTLIEAAGPLAPGIDAAPAVEILLFHLASDTKR